MKRKQLLPIILASSMLLCSCKVMIETEVRLPAQTNEDEIRTDTDVLEGENQLTGEVIQIEQVSLDLEDMVKTYLDLSLSEAEAYELDFAEVVGSSYYEKGTQTLICLNNNFSYWDDIDGASGCYDVLMCTTYATEYLKKEMREIFPLEEIETCSKEEAIAFCQPYAEVCGYGNADISVYAMDLDAIARLNDFHEGNLEAPEEGFVQMTRKEYWEGQKKVEDGEMTQEELMDQWFASPSGEWEKKYEAMMLIYRPYINGSIMDSYVQMLTLLYVPYYNRIICAKGYAPYSEIGISSEEPIISQEKAVNKLLTTIGASSQEDIIIDDISLVYSLRYELANADVDT